MKGRQKIIFSSPLQIENESKINLNVLIKLNSEMESNMDEWRIADAQIISIEKDDKLARYACVFCLKPGEVYYVPLIYAYKCRIYVTPDVHKYLPTIVFDLRGYNMKINGLERIFCKSRATHSATDLSSTTSIIDEQGVEQNFEILKQLSLNVTKHRNMMLPTLHANYRIVLHAPIIILNSLPFQIRVDVAKGENNMKFIDPGQSLSIYLPINDTDDCRLHIINYLNTTWVGRLNFKNLINDQLDVDVICMDVAPSFNAMYVTNRHLSLHIAYKKPNQYTIYSPYWVVNKSGQQLQLRATKSSKVFDVPDEAILLFDFKQSKKTNRAKLSVNGGHWSKSFSLDAAGTTGIVETNDGYRSFNFLLRTTMSNSSRTKLITIAPYLTIINELDETVHVADAHALDSKKEIIESQFVEIPSIKQNKDQRPIAFWPEYSSFKSLSFVMRMSDGRRTKPFPLENPGHFVLVVKGSVLTNEGAASASQMDLDDKCHDSYYTVFISGGSQSPVTVVIRPYEHGDSVAKLVNLCDNLKIIYKQKGEKDEMACELHPDETVYFIWDDFTKANRELMWTFDTTHTDFTQMPPVNKYAKAQVSESGTTNHEFRTPNTNENGSEDDDDDAGLSTAPIEVEISDANNPLISSSSVEICPVNKHKSTHAAAKQQKKKAYRITRLSSVSYMDGRQRVILFTTDEQFAQLVTRKEASGMEIYVSLNGIRCSLINNLNLELSTIGISSSGAVWTMKTTRPPLSTKKFTNEYSTWLEKRYREYLIHIKNKKIAQQFGTLVHMDDSVGCCYTIDNKLTVNYRTMKVTLLGPLDETGSLEREWSPAISVQYRTSRNMLSLKCRVYSMQVDNQLPDAYFPISFYKAPVRLSGLVSQQTTKFVPFVDLTLFTEQHDVLQIYRHFEFILQEFYLKADKGFVFSLKDWYDAAVDNKDVRFVSSDHHDSILNATDDRSLTVVETNKDLKQAIEVDMCIARDIMEYADKKSGDLKQSAHILFDFVRLSPIVCNLSFSVNGTIHTDDSIAPERATDTIFNFFLESIGSTITEFKDVKFRFAVFKIAHDTKTWDELYFSVFDHYKIQALRQAYVLIFGLDVLGNPFGLVTDLSEGLTDLFYEPLIGYLSKDVKTLDIHMGHKVKSTVDKTISSAAGSASLITGSIGRILATCTFDKDFKRKRQYKLAKTSTMSLTDCFAIAGKGIIAGAIYGITGLVQSPVKETRIGGFKGVFKGIGKGLTGFFTKPMSSVFDGVSITFDGIKRHSQSGDETVQQIRLPRHLLSNVAILPFSEYQSMGYEILRDLQNDNIAVGEYYWAHLFCGTTKKPVLLFITHCNIYRLMRTYTQILNKWELIDPYISLKDMKLNEPEISERANTAKHTQDLYKLEATVQDKRGVKKRSIVNREQLDTVNWIREKIESAKNYLKETKELFGASLDE